MRLLYGITGLARTLCALSAGAVVVTVTALLLVPSAPARAEALNTTTLGFARRTATITPPFVANEASTAPAAGGASTTSRADQTIVRVQDGPLLCNRVSTPTSVRTIEISGGSCLHQGGETNLNHALSASLQIIYYPFSSRGDAGMDDMAISLQHGTGSNLYIYASGGFSKISIPPTDASPVTYTIDTADVGGGAGYGYRLFRKVALGLEGGFVASSSISSKVAKGSATTIQVSAVVTVFL